MSSANNVAPKPPRPPPRQMLWDGVMTDVLAMRRKCDTLLTPAPSGEEEKK